MKGELCLYMVSSLQLYLYMLLLRGVHISLYFYHIISIFLYLQVLKSYLITLDYAIVCFKHNEQLRHLILVIYHYTQYTLCIVYHFLLKYLFHNLLCLYLKFNTSHYIFIMHPIYLLIQIS